MASWIELLPEGAQNFIVIEVRHPKSWRENQEIDNRVRDEIWALPANNEYYDSKDELCQQLGVDFISILAVPIQEHWRRQEGEPGQPGRRPGPPPREVFVNVHLPASVATTPERVENVTRTVMDWFESSALGQIMLRVGHSHNMAHVSASGSSFATAAELTHIQQSEDIRDSISRGATRP